MSNFKTTIAVLGLIVSQPGNSGFAQPAKPAQSDQQEAIRRLGGIQIYGPSGPANQFRAMKALRIGMGVGQAVTDDSLRELANIQFGDIQQVELHSPKVTDAGLKHLAVFKNLLVLKLDRTQVTGTGLKDLATSSRLFRLTLNRTAVTDDGLKEVLNFRELSELDLSESQITDAGLKHVSQLSNLRLLNLHATSVTDAGIKDIAAMVSLTDLDLSQTEVTDEGLKQLAQAPKLATLWLGKTNVTSDGFRHLANIKSLSRLYFANKDLTDAHFRILHQHGLFHCLNANRHPQGVQPQSDDEVVALDLTDSQITDEGLSALADLKNLSTLWLTRTAVTRTGLKELAKFKDLKSLDVSGTTVFRLQAGSAMEPLRESPDGRLTVILDGSSVQLVDTATQQPVGKMLHHGKPKEDQGTMTVNCWAFSPDGVYLATGAGYSRIQGKEETNLGEICIWEVATGKRLFGAGYTGRSSERIGSVNAVVFSENSQTVIYQADKFRYPAF